MKEIVFRLFGHNFSYQDLLQLVVALILWTLMLIWHDRYHAYKPLIEMAVNQKLLP